MSKVMTTRPNKETIHHAVDRAAAWPRKRYQQDPRFSHYTEGAFLEQICGQEGALFDLGDGWWRAGVVMDSIGGVELDVLVNPGERKIRLREPAPAPEKAPPMVLPEKPVQATMFPDERGRNRLKWDEW
jgi:hypothetical protein